MKIPTRRIELSEIGYEGYWVDMPRSVKEGWINEFASRTRPSTNGNEPDDGESFQSARRANLMLLDMITAWNIDDDKGEVLPLTSTLSKESEKAKILGELPVDVLQHIAESLVQGTQTNEKVLDFSSKS